MPLRKIRNTGRLPSAISIPSVSPSQFPRFLHSPTAVLWQWTQCADRTVERMLQRAFGVSGCDGLWSFISANGDPNMWMERQYVSAKDIVTYTMHTKWVSAQELLFP